MRELLLNSLLLGVGLAMDAFAVSAATGLAQPSMGRGRAFGICGTFGGFQFAMPVIGWLLVHTAAEHFEFFRRFIPWIALLLLGYIGGKMLYEGFKGGGEASVVSDAKSLILLALATSIDALSTGFAISDYKTADAFICAAIIGVVTVGICLLGVLLGKKIGSRIAGRASVLGGVILIAIGLEIFAKGVLK